MLSTYNKRVNKWYVFGSSFIGHINNGCFLILVLKVYHSHSCPKIPISIYFLKFIMKAKLFERLSTYWSFSKEVTNFAIS